VAVPLAPAFDAVLHGMSERVGIETLPAHLETTHGITVAGLRQLDVGVFYVVRPRSAVEGTWLCSAPWPTSAFPPRDPFGERPLSIHEGQSVLVTEFVREVPKA
jgi:hypothetical protein